MLQPSAKVAAELCGGEPIASELGRGRAESSRSPSRSARAPRNTQVVASEAAPCASSACLGGVRAFVAEEDLRLAAPQGAPASEPLSALLQGAPGAPRQSLVARGYAAAAPLAAPWDEGPRAVPVPSRHGGRASRSPSPPALPCRGPAGGSAGFAALLAAEPRILRLPDLSGQVRMQLACAENSDVTAQA